MKLTAANFRVWTSAALMVLILSADILILLRPLPDIVAISILLVLTALSQLVLSRGVQNKTREMLGERTMSLFAKAKQLGIVLILLLYLVFPALIPATYLLFFLVFLYGLTLEHIAFLYSMWRCKKEGG